MFARSTGRSELSAPLAGQAERWRGVAGTDDVRRDRVAITDTGVAGDSPYAELSRNGATIFPRVLFFVNETTNTATIQAAPTITVNPRRGSQDKAPWKDLDLTAISAQTVESIHLLDVYLGETVVPYATLDPLKAVLPIKQGVFSVPAEVDGLGGVRLSGLERRMRERWRIVNNLWETNKAPTNNLKLLERLDYVGNLSSQLDWQREHCNRPVRLVYTSSGQPAAALLADDSALVENVLFWVACKNTDEANYLLAIINSVSLYNSVSGIMPKGLFGPRHLHKHLWKLPIPEFDITKRLHNSIAKAGVAAAAGAQTRLAEVRELEERQGDELTVALARRELRKWLRYSEEGQAVESAVAKLLAGG